MEEEAKAVCLTIDGKEVRVPKGTTILQAAKGIGIEIPHYCYHPGLSSPGMCRLCLVEVTGALKLMPACVTATAEGQEVHTDSPLALSMRRGVLEFYAVNHALECPICDMSGECYFQDYLHLEGRPQGRAHEPKRVLGREDFGGDVLFYADRCVMCTRCIRFMNEIEQEERLTVVERGDRSIIGTFFGEGLEGTHWHGNIVDICPVGALVSKDFLHKARAWDLDHTDSVCPNCSQGCNISLHTRDNLVQRIKPRENPEVNAHWMCDYGRLNYEWINGGSRLDAPMVLEETAPRPASWEEALSTLVSRLEGDSGLEVKAVASPFSSNEDLGSLKALVDHLGGGEIVYRSKRGPNEVALKGLPGLARRCDLVPNGTGAHLMNMVRTGSDSGVGGLEDVARHDGIILVLADALSDEGDDFGADAALYVYLGTHLGRATARADFSLPITTFAEAEGTFTNLDRRVQRFWPALLPPGAARPTWLILGAILAELAGSEVPERAKDSFALVATQVAPLAGLSYHDLGLSGAVIPGGT